MTLILNGTDNSATTPAVTGTDTDTGVFFPAANVVAFATSGTEDARFDASGNLLVGATSQIYGNAGNIQSFGTANFVAGGNAGSGTCTALRLINNNSGVTVGTVTYTNLGTSYTGVNGITFTATQAASADANTLDDYEEGSFTPVFTTTGTGFTSGGNTSTGTYTKVGRLVTVQVNAVLSGAVSAGTGDVVITGLPFTVGLTGYGPFAPGRITITTTNYWTFVNLSLTSISVSSAVSAANGTALPASAVNGNNTPYFSTTITYFV